MTYNLPDFKLWINEPRNQKWKQGEREESWNFFFEYWKKDDNWEKVVQVAPKMQWEGKILASYQKAVCSWIKEVDQREREAK